LAANVAHLTQNAGSEPGSVSAGRQLVTCQTGPVASDCPTAQLKGQAPGRPCDPAWASQASI